MFPRHAVEFAGAAPLTHGHRSDGSGLRVDVRACPRCATTLALTFERFPDVCALLRGTLDDPDRFAIERRFFTRSAARGTLLPAGADCWAEYAVAPDGTPIAPTRYPATMVASGRGGPLRPAGADLPDPDPDPGPACADR